jgi:hypothetical protein
VATCLYNLFGINIIKEASQEPLSASEAFFTCGLVVDVTVQERDRPMIGFEAVKKYYSG